MWPFHNKGLEYLTQMESIIPVSVMIQFMTPYLLLWRLHKH